MFKVLRQLQYFTRAKLNTQVFSNFTDRQMSTPELMKKVIIKPIHMHSRVSQRHLFHRKRVRHDVKSCFSEKKTKIFKRVHKIKRLLYSQILGKKLHLTFSSKAFRCLKKMGSFDKYILLTKPFNLDSKYGQYLREIMLRKINDPSWRVPYIIGEGKKLRIKHYQKYQHVNASRVFNVPRIMKEKLFTLQRQFGTRASQLNEEDYAKFLELRKLKKDLGSQFDPSHPLIDELKQKMAMKWDFESEQQVKAMAKKAEQDYLNRPGHKQYRRIKVEKAKRVYEQYEQKMKDIEFKEMFE